METRLTAMGTEQTFRIVDLWKVNGAATRRFRCIEDTSSSKVAVVTVDFVRENEKLDLVVQQDHWFRQKMPEVDDLQFFESFDLAMRAHEVDFC
jgi:hypothetical protein